jgi:hypothetical protein
LNETLQEHEGQVTGKCCEFECTSYTDHCMLEGH